MPDRYGDRDEDDEPPVVFDHLPAEGPAVIDFDSRRRAREVEEASQRARAQRERLAESRATHAPLGREQSMQVRHHQREVTKRADDKRNALRIRNCALCDDDGYLGATVCDHVDRRESHAHGIATVRALMGWADPSTPSVPAPQPPVGRQPSKQVAPSHHTQEAESAPAALSEPPEFGGS